MSWKSESDGIDRAEPDRSNRFRRQLRKQNDEESGLDFAEARMCENRHGRFTAVDPLLASGKSANPQTFNRFVYVLNSPLTMSDPDGLQAGRWVFPTAGGDGKYLKNDKPIPKGYFEVTERNRNGDLVVPWSQSKSTTSGDKTYYDYYDYVVRLNEFGPRTPQTFIDSRTGRTFKESLSFYERQGWEVIKGDGYHYVHPATGAVVNAIEPIDVALVLAPFKFGAVARGTTITRLGVAGESSTTVPYRLALGLGDVKAFARTTKSVTYIERTGTRLFIPEKFERLARNATEINFNFGARATGNQFSVSRFAVWQRNGRPLQSGTFTMQELDFILSNREILNKTRFHVFPGN
ncbi:MAG: hypothetical protein IPJ30_09885 [Acidobacteria bacterium]|nr:hypothetical protein [Acidobacteriota bacterium]